MIEDVDVMYEESKFCSACGKHLLPEVREQYGYSRVTGEPVYMYTKTCPDYNARQYGSGSHDIISRYERVQ